MSSDGLHILRPPVFLHLKPGSSYALVGSVEEFEDSWTEARRNATLLRVNAVEDVRRWHHGDRVGDLPLPKLTTFNPDTIQSFDSVSSATDARLYGDLLAAFHASRPSSEQEEKRAADGQVAMDAEEAEREHGRACDSALAGLAVELASTSVGRSVFFDTSGREFAGFFIDSWVHVASGSSDNVGYSPPPSTSTPSAFALTDDGLVFHVKRPAVAGINTNPKPRKGERWAGSFMPTEMSYYRNLIMESASSFANDHGLLDTLAQANGHWTRPDAAARKAFRREPARLPTPINRRRKWWR